jgi:hypothetical protein
MQCLKTCLDLVISNLPRVFDADSRVTIDGGDLRGLERFERRYAGTKYSEAVAAVRQVSLVFDNRAEVMDLAWIGFYQSLPQRIVGVRISALMRSAETVSLDAVLAYRNPDVVIQSFRSILLHEFRHVFQSFLYPGYYEHIINSNVDYKRDKTEIDASWMHHLEDYNPRDFDRPERYAREVMDSLAGYKILTEKEKQHYFRKTARYYLSANG